MTQGRLLPIAVLLACSALAETEAHAQSCSASATEGAPAAQPLPGLATGKIFVSHGRSGLISILDLKTGAVTTLESQVTGPHEVAVSPDGRWAVAADFGNFTGDFNFDGRRLAVIDLAQNRVARVIDLGANRGPHELVFLPGSSTRVIVTTQTTRNVVEVDVVSGQVVASTPTEAGGSHNVAVARDGRTAFTSNEADGTVSVLDLSTHAMVRKFTVGAPPAEGIAVTPDGREAWVAFRGEGVVRVVDAASGKVAATLTGFSSTERLAITPDGRRALITDLRCRDIKIADVASRRVIGAISDLRDAAQAKVLPDSRVAVVALLRGGEVAIVDIEARRVLARHSFGRGIDAAAWGPTPPADAPR